MIRREREGLHQKHWAIETGTSFNLGNQENLDRFSEYVTNINNASVILESRFYKVDRDHISSYTQEKLDINSLRKKGARFKCLGNMILPSFLVSIRIPAQIGLEVTEYIPKEKVSLESKNLFIAGIDLSQMADIKASWDFCNSGQNIANFQVSCRIDLPNQLDKIAGLFPCERLVKQELEITKAKIIRGFKSSR